MEVESSTIDHGRQQVDVSVVGSRWLSGVKYEQVAS